MRAIAGLHRPVDGSIFFAGHEIVNASAHAIARSGLALVPEGRQVFPELSVEDKLHLGAYGKPTLGAARVDELFAALAQLRAEARTLLLVDHMTRMALSLADRAYVITSGKIVFAGTAEEPKHNPVLERACLCGA